MPTLHMIILHIFMYTILLFIALDTMRLFFNHYKKDVLNQNKKPILTSELDEII